jgi:hypothetical protein
VLIYLRAVGSELLRKAVAYYEQEPVRVHAAITAGVLAAAAAAGLVLSAPAVAVVVVFVVPVLVANLRRKVSPAAKADVEVVSD